jgi:hypothetical protein
MLAATDPRAVVHTYGEGAPSGLRSPFTEVALIEALEHLLATAKLLLHATAVGDGPPDGPRTTRLAGQCEEVIESDW